MIVSKESIRDIAELMTQHILSESTHSAITEMECVDYDFEVSFDCKVDNKRNSAHIKVTHKGCDLGTVQMSDCDIMTSNVWTNEKKVRWITSTTEYLVRQLSKYLVKKFVTEDDALVDVKKRLEASSDTVKWSIGPLNFSGSFGHLHMGIRCKTDTGFVLYENIKTNNIGMTTEQGFQGMNVSNIMSDCCRVLMAALAQESVTFTVAV